MAYPYTPAFVAFCKGAPPEEISQMFDIPLESLKAKMRQEGWRTLANQMAPQITPDIQRNEGILAKIEANRATNYETAAELRKDLEKVVGQLIDGTLRVKKQWQHSGKVIEYESEPSIADRLNIANYAKTIADLTYRALGDHVANGGRQEDAPAGAHPPSPPVTILLPAAIALPRHERNITPTPVEIGNPG